MITDLYIRFFAYSVVIDVYSVIFDAYPVVFDAIKILNERDLEVIIDAIPISFDTPIIPEKVPKTQIITGFVALLKDKIHGRCRGLCLHSEDITM